MRNSDWCPENDAAWRAEHAECHVDLREYEERAEVFRIKYMMASDEAAELRAKLGRLCTWACEMIETLTRDLGADPQGTWSAGESDTLHQELRNTARQYNKAGRSRQADVAANFIEAMLWHEECEQFWKDNQPVQDTAFWRCWETTMDEAQEHYEQAYAAVKAYYE